MAKCRIRLSIAATLACVGLLAAGCGSPQKATSASAVGSVTSAGISADRCQANRDAGEITYLTGFDFAAAAGIVDAVVAKEKGYFDKMCLNVKVQSGFDTSNIALVSSGKAQFTALGSVSEVADANAHGGNVEAIGVLGHKAVEALAVSAKANISTIQQVKGTTMGVLGTIPFSVRVMLVENGVPIDSLTQVETDFNPLSLDANRFASRPVYKSNEPRQLDAANVKYSLFDPAKFDVAASFAAITVNKDFAKAHPSATQDFLRAQLMGFKAAAEDPAAAVNTTYKKADPKYYLSSAGESFRWATELQLVKESTPQGKPFGYVDSKQISAEIEPLVSKVKSLSTMPDISTVVDPSVVQAVTDGAAVVWPSA